ncbi:COMPASS component SDC1 [Yarrowia sp. B02]|nr:COMPASS component SDC1 [Yarrowia sp. B02]
MTDAFPEAKIEPGTAPAAPAAESAPLTQTAPPTQPQIQPVAPQIATPQAVATPPAEIKQEVSAASTASLPNPAENYGAPTRLWLNKEVTPALLAGMRQIAKDKPEDPVKALGEFLIAYKK